MCTIFKFTLDVMQKDDNLYALYSFIIHGIHLAMCWLLLFIFLIIKCNLLHLCLPCVDNTVRDSLFVQQSLIALYCQGEIPGWCPVIREKKSLLTHLTKTQNTNVKNNNFNTQWLLIKKKLLFQRI